MTIITAIISRLRAVFSWPEETPVVTSKQLALIVGRNENALMTSIITALVQFGASILPPHRLAQYLAQLAHESGGFQYSREIWGPTAAQLRYEGRKDLGNTKAGDGYKYRGRGPIQLTGRANYRAFTAWAKTIAPAAPDFEADPDAVLLDPWLGLVPIWYWLVGNPTGQSLNRYADTGDIETITRRINGGLNGFVDRQRYCVRAGLVLSGFAPDDVKGFQRFAGLTVDGKVGPITSAAIHQTLKG